MQVIFSYICFRQGYIHYGDDVLLMRTRCQFRHHATEIPVHILPRDNIGKDAVAVDHRCGSLITGRFDAKDVNIF